MHLMICGCWGLGHWQRVQGQHPPTPVKVGHYMPPSESVLSAGRHLQAVWEMPAGAGPVRLGVSLGKGVPLPLAVNFILGPWPSGGSSRDFLGCSAASGPGAAWAGASPCGSSLTAWDKALCAGLSGPVVLKAYLQENHGYPLLPTRPLAAKGRRLERDAAWASSRCVLDVPVPLVSAQLPFGVGEAAVGPGGSTRSTAAWPVKLVQEAGQGWGNGRGWRLVPCWALGSA